MEVMVVAPYFYPRIGGLESYVYNISKLLIQKHGISISVICSNWEREGYKEEVIEVENQEDTEVLIGGGWPRGGVRLIL